MKKHVKYCTWAKDPASQMARRLQRRVYQRKWWAANLFWAKVSRALRVRGMTLDQYHAMYENQDFACAICGDCDSPLVVDHDHETGKPRGLLCNRCNTGIGMFGESHRVFAGASAYIAKHQGA